MHFDIFTFYKFTPFQDLTTLKGDLLGRLDPLGVRGTIILAEEGINGTLCAPNTGESAAASAVLKSLPGCEDLDVRFSQSEARPFLRLKIRLKSEIVTMGVPDVDPNDAVGVYVEPTDWNDLISDPDTIVIDTRNAYEYSVGTFEGAIDPNTKSFREFPDWFRKHRSDNPNTKYAMFCTGGIRCEKATSFLKSEGIDDVFHLKGGILSYLEKVPTSESKWQGDCFVFDERVTVRHGLVPGDYQMCHACKHPLSQEDLRDAFYELGVSCRHCVGSYSDERRAAFKERQRQIRLAKDRNQQHMGPESIAALKNNKSDSEV